MKIKKSLFYLILLCSFTSIKAQETPLYNHVVQDNFKIGINLTGLERHWDNKPWNYKNTITHINELYEKGIRDIRLPISFEHQFSKQSKRSFLRKLKKIIKHVKKKNMSLIICYFDHKMEKETRFTNVDIIKKNWKYISYKLKKYSDCIYYEIVNEPNLYPQEWNRTVHELVSTIREKDKKTKILIGATNYNSIYELSRKTPYAYENLIYVFHFYEPFLFTHQGANWVGNQSTTTDLPYPYDSIVMPKINPKAIGTAGQINYKDYKHMANKTSLTHKIDLVVNWANKNKVKIWCTEFGTISSISEHHRQNYFTDLISIFKKQNIKCYLWEYKGNFGVENTLNSLITL